MTKREYLKKQQELIDQKWQAYDNKDYALADAIQAELDALVDPEPDELLTDDDDLMALLSKDEIGLRVDDSPSETSPNRRRRRATGTAETNGWCDLCHSYCWGDCQA